MEYGFIIPIHLFTIIIYYRFFNFNFIYILMSLYSLVFYLKRWFTQGIVYYAVRVNNMTLVLNYKYLNNVFLLFRLSSLFRWQILHDIIALDYIKSKVFRFKVYYVFSNLKAYTFLKIGIFLKEYQILNTIFYIFCNANWSEREIYDLFGIFFVGHPDLRRILTDYGFIGHPSRRDFPAIGFLELIFSDLVDHLVYRSVKLDQNWRQFILNVKWLKNI